MLGYCPDKEGEVLGERSRMQGSFSRDTRNARGKDRHPIEAKRG